MFVYDVIIIGSGIVGAATAWQLKCKYPNKRILVLEKEAHCALHQTGRNSGVIHAGVYYQPGSLKAKFCQQGLRDTIEFCRTHSIAYEQCGKLLVATNELELQRMEALFKRCQENAISPQLLSQKELIGKEPNIRGKGAIWVEQTGITDYKGITRTMLQLFQNKGGVVAYEKEVTAIEESDDLISIQCENERFHSRFMINCAGLMADRLIRMQGIETDFSIIPFKGEYFQLPTQLNSIVNHLIYPIPDPELPFLGVHLTKMIDGTVTVGPSAVLAFKREGYGKFQMDIKDMLEVAMNKGFWYLMRKYYQSGINELKCSMFKKEYLKLVNKYCPQISVHDLLPYPCGIRAQAVRHTGELMHDFAFVQTDRSLHIGNAPSPAATSAIPIAKNIVKRWENNF